MDDLRKSYLKKYLNHTLTNKDYVYFALELNTDEKTIIKLLEELNNETTT